MRTLALAFAVTALALAGCVSPVADAPVDPAAASAPVAAEPVVLEWSGRILASQLGMLVHMEPSEQLLAPVQAEGFGMEILAVPQEFKVELAWDGPGSPELSIMVDVPLKEGAGSFATPMSGEKSLCMLVPVADLVAGKLAVMTHSRSAMDVEYTFTVTLSGGDGKILDGGHTAAEPGEAEHEPGLACDGSGSLGHGGH